MLDVPASVEEFVVRLEAAREIRVVDPSSGERAEWRKLIFAVTSGSVLPAEVRLRHEGRDRGDLVMRLEYRDVDVRSETSVPVVVVPERISRWHPALAATRVHVGRTTKEWVDTRRHPDLLHLSVTGPNFARALRCVQALLDAAVERGHRVVLTKTCGCDGGVAVMVGDDPVEVVVIEPAKRSAHELTATEQARAEKSAWSWTPKYDYTPTGRLELHAGHDRHHKALAGDRTRWTLEDRLGHALVRIEEVADEYRARREQRERYEREREAQRIAVAEHAHLERIDAARRDHANAQLRDRRLAGAFRELLAEVNTSDTTADPDWVAWINAYADRLDPTRRPFTGPDIPEGNPLY